jgi:hypothetical protein
LAHDDQCCLTVKLRGRTEAPDGAEGAQFLSARGAQPRAHHGPLQRLLDGALMRPTVVACIAVAPAIVPTMITGMMVMRIAVSARSASAI